MAATNFSGSKLAKGIGFLIFLAVGSHATI